MEVNNPTKVDVAAKAVNYQFNIRSFHPEKSFGWSGLNFQGDNRGFSLEPSGRNLVTSRIWHQISINPSASTVLIGKTESDPSQAPWQGKPYEYNSLDLKPKSRIFRTPPSKKPDGKTISTVKGQYWGANHAMPLSTTLQENFEGTYVPEIDVSYTLVFTVNLKERYINIGALVEGDGFPNTEAFITDPSGNSVFLGIHVRQGAAPLTLMANFTHKLFGAVIRLPLKQNGASLECF